MPLISSRARDQPGGQLDLSGQGGKVRGAKDDAAITIATAIEHGVAPLPDTEHEGPGHQAHHAPPQHHLFSQPTVQQAHDGFGAAPAGCRSNLLPSLPEVAARWQRRLPPGRCPA
jgi:hypothetical protein